MRHDVILAVSQIELGPKSWLLVETSSVSSSNVAIWLGPSGSEERGFGQARHDAGQLQQ